MIRSILYTISALLLLSGCTKELTEPGSRNDGKMRISFSTPVITDDTATPPPATGRETTQSSPRTSITENTTIRVVVYLAGGMTYVADQTYYMNGGKLKTCTVNADGTFKEVDMQNELALIPDKYDFYAITPALPLNADQKTVTVPNGVDYASSVTPNITVNSDQTLTLTQLSRKSAKIALEVKKAEDNTAMTALKLNPSGKGVIISALPASQGVTLNADIPAATGTTTLTIPASVFTLNGTTSTATTYLLPRLGTSRLSLSYDLTYTVSNTQESKTVSGSMGNTVLEKGKSYTFTLTMRKTGASLTVIDWIESNQEVVTGQELDYTDNGKPWFLIAANDSKNPTDVTKATMNWYVATGTYDATYNPDAKKACPDGWRVPTQFESIMLWVCKNGMLNDRFETSYYWTSSSSSSMNAWITRMSLGSITSMITIEVDNSIMTTTNYVRCIRDTPLPDKKYPYVDKDAKTIVARDNQGGVNLGAIHETWSTTPLHNETSTYNSLSKKFEIAREDCNSSNASGVANTNSQYIYSNVVKACAAYSEGSSNGFWRVPTQRELMLTLFMHNNGLLKGVNAFMTTNDYWTGTYQKVDNNAWRILFGTGRVTTEKNEASFYVRCVRDVQ